MSNGHLRLWVQRVRGTSRVRFLLRPWESGPPEKCNARRARAGEAGKAKPNSPDSPPGTPTRATNSGHLRLILGGRRP
jgi:hypothetical protein